MILAAFEFSCYVRCWSYFQVTSHSGFQSIDFTSFYELVEIGDDFTRYDFFTFIQILPLGIFNTGNEIRPYFRYVARSAHDEVRVGSDIANFYNRFRS